MRKIDLRDSWKIKGVSFNCAEDSVETIKPDIDTSLPTDVHIPLTREGIIKDITIGENSYEAEWISEKAWWFKKSFALSKNIAKDNSLELVLDGLDYNATIYLNGKEIGTHQNTHRPFVKDITSLVSISGDENTLLIRLSVGTEIVSKDMVGEMPRGATTEEGNGNPKRGDERRHFLRKPQYVFGWDWSAKAPTVGLANAYINLIGESVIRDVYVYAKEEDYTEKSLLTTVEMSVENTHPYKSTWASVSVNFTDEDGVSFNAHKEEIFISSGINYISIPITINKPRLWYPASMGKPHRYSVKISLTTKEHTYEYPHFYWGARFIRLDKNPFSFVVNSQRVFAKGANWIPADIIYAAVSQEKYEKLVLEAKEANFNMLRVWGGGVYESEHFYEACDKAGIMVWQDFMFTTSLYPDHRKEFCEEVRLEAEYQIKRLRNRASLALWCGSNEITWAYKDWWNEVSFSGTKIFNYILPQAVKLFSPHVDYWLSSPYGGEESPNSYDSGDCHYWGEAMMNSDMNKRITYEEYDKCSSVFVSEYGYVGPCGLESIKDFMNSDEIDINSTAYKHHTNVFEKDTVLAGIEKHYADTKSLDLESYVRYGQLVQGNMLAYSLESFRYRQNCFGGLFWMYADCWGETGWTIIDYYLRRKASFYFVKRAFTPLRLLLRFEDANVCLTIVNDTADDFDGEVEYGYMSFDGEEIIHKARTFVPAYNRVKSLNFAKEKNEKGRGVYFARSLSIAHSFVLYDTTIRECSFVKPFIMKNLTKAEDGYILSLTSNVVAHAIEIKAEGVLSDNYFDMLKGEKKEVFIKTDEEINEESITIRSAIF